MSGRLLQLYAAAVISLGVLVVLWYWRRARLSLCVLQLTSK